MVIDVRSVPSDFHARYKAQERTQVSTVPNFDIDAAIYGMRILLYMDCGNCKHDLSCMNQQFIEFSISTSIRIQLKYEGVASPNALEYAYLGSRADYCAF